MHTFAVSRAHMRDNQQLYSMIDNQKAQDIKDAANIVDVVSDFVQLKRSGSEYTGRCPFHEDRHTGSFMVSPKKNIATCFPCGKTWDPVGFLQEITGLSYPDALRYLAEKYGISTGEEYDRAKFKNIKPAQPRTMKIIDEQQLPKRIWPTAWIGYYKNLAKDNFVTWLQAQPWGECEKARLPQVLNDYHVGHTTFATKYRGTEDIHDFTIWWMLDEDNRLHNAHMMKYKPDGHRDKTSGYNQTWLHARMKYATGTKHFDENKEAPSYCLFGQHLLNAYPQATINIVESEKTAVIMAVAYGNNASQIWMACCGLQNLKRERLQPLIDQRRTIQLFPDRDGINKWIEKASEINYNGMELNTQAVTQWWMPCDGDKADIADVVIRIINKRS